MHTIYVYGTLRPGLKPTVTLKGEMRNLGWFPGVKLDENSGYTFQTEPIVVDDKSLETLDRYEGYHKNNPSASLYIRKSIEIDGKPAWIYEYNQEFYDDHHPLVESGDWLTATASPKGRAHNMGE